MREIIKDKAVVSDDWTVLPLIEGGAPEAAAVPAGKTIVPLAVWLAQRAALQQRADIGVWIASHERPEVLKDDVAKLPVIAVDFPKFSDGRGYSIAYNLRARLGYAGELRAIGDVLRDQMFYMQRVGFNAFATREDRNIHDALKSLFDFSDAYQASLDQKMPLFKRQVRGVQSQDTSRKTGTDFSI
ncbi:MAG TPA: oxidoreductase [Oxalobacteraceae bacterium]|nr:oxidoreductase [Oxalobacteraceae bacterium]